MVKKSKELRIMAFKLEKRTYNWKDMIVIPFTCAPVSTIVYSLQKLSSALSNIFLIIVVAEFIDKATLAAAGAGEVSDVLPWFAFLIILVSWSRVAYNVGRIFNRHVELQVNDQVSREIVMKRGRLHYSLIEDAETGKLVSRVFHHVEKNFAEMVRGFANMFFVYIVRIIGVFSIIFSRVWWLGFVIILFMIPLVFLSVKGGKQIYQAGRQAAVSERRHLYLGEILTGREMVDERSIFGYSEKLNKEWHNQFEHARRINLRAGILWTLNSQAGSGITSILSTTIVIIMIPLAASGKMTIGVFIALATAVYDLVRLAGWEITNGVLRLTRYNEYLKDFTAFANLLETEGAEMVPQVPMVFQSLEFKSVSFRYPKTDAYILKNLSLKIEEGKHVAFVGENGAGKTTITKLLTGLYDDYEGQIFLNERNLKEYTPAMLKGMFSGVYQDFARYYISVEDNLFLGDINHFKSEESRMKMNEILEKLGLYDVLNSLPKGLATKIGKLEDNSVDFSGGQWQRLAMARALMNPAPVQIMDEPAAALDPISESRLYEEFEEISKGRTTIFISHRLGSTKLADHIFVLRDGGVMEEGSHEALMEKRGLYEEMYRSQQSWYLEDGKVLV